MIKGENINWDALFEDYYNIMPIKEICKKYNISDWDLYDYMKANNIPNRRYNQKYKLYDDYAEIYIRKGRDYVKALIDIEDVERCKEIGIWSLTNAGYVMNCKKDIYLHRFIMNASSDIEIDHINHNPLDNRKSQLREATSSQQKMNTKKRIDNTSGHRGVYFDKSRGTWNININFSGMSFRKRYKTKEEAFKKADEIYDKYFGEFKCKMK